MKVKPVVSLTVFLAVLALLLAVPFIIGAINEGRDIPVLMYHGFAEDPGNDVWTVSTAEFERQMREMKADGRKSILPNQLALAARGLYLLPAKPVVITMDDGFRDNVTLAEPIMRKYGMKGIEYLIISHIEDSIEKRSRYRDRENIADIGDLDGLHTDGVTSRIALLCGIRRCVPAPVYDARGHIGNIVAASDGRFRLFFLGDIVDGYIDPAGTSVLV